MPTPENKALLNRVRQLGHLREAKKQVKEVTDDMQQFVNELLWSCLTELVSSQMGIYQWPVVCKWLSDTIDPRQLDDEVRVALQTIAKYGYDYDNFMDDVDLIESDCIWTNPEDGSRTKFISLEGGIYLLDDSRWQYLVYKLDISEDECAKAWEYYQS